MKAIKLLFPTVAAMVVAAGLAWAQFSPTQNGGNIPGPGAGLSALFSGHIVVPFAPGNTNVPTIDSGSTGTLDANAADTAFTYTGTGSATTSVQVDFGTAFLTQPHCVASPDNAAASTAGLVSITAVMAHAVITYGSAASTKWTVMCLGTRGPN